MTGHVENGLSQLSLSVSTALVGPISEFVQHGATAEE